MIYTKARFLIPCRSLLILCLVFLGTCPIAQAQDNKDTQSQELATIMPDESSLQGFARLRPAGETYLLPEWSVSQQKWVTPVSAPEVIQDDFTLNLNLKRAYGVGGLGNRMERQLYSTDGIYHISIELLACDSQVAASNFIDTIRHQSQAITTSGSVGNTSQIGDESWVDASNNGKTQNAGFLLMRVGKLVATISGSISNSVRQQGSNIVFPGVAIQSVAYQILLKASQQPDVTGVSAQAAQVDVNGHTLPKSALKVAGRVYVPVQEFAKAMGMTSQWNNKTGALTLSRPTGKTIVLTAGSTTATVGGVKAASLTVPVLKSGGQPVMTLGDLLRLTGGRITGHAGNTVQVKG